MSRILDLPQFYDVGHRSSRERSATRQDDDSSDEFWPEVSRQALPDELSVNPANTPKRVLFEVFLVLAAALGSVAAVVLLVPSP